MIKIKQKQDDVFIDDFRHKFNFLSCANWKAFLLMVDY